MLVCESCHRREATQHLTRIVDGVTSTRHWCAECAEEFELITHYTCFFCGRSANIGGTEVLAQALGIHRLRFFCFRCGRVYSSEVARVRRSLAKDTPPEDRDALLEKISAEVESRVRQRLAESDER